MLEAEKNIEKQFQGIPSTQDAQKYITYGESPKADVFKQRIKQANQDFNLYQS